MRRLLATAFVVCSPLAFPASLPPLVCSSGGPIGTVDLRVDPAKNGDKPLPLRTINRLEEGEILTYRPVLRPKEERKGEVDMVLVPAEGVHAAEPLLVFPAKEANQPQQWKVPWRVGLIAFVYGPSGLNVRKVKGFLSKDSDVVGELADYADKTTRTEALLAELSSPNTSSERFQSALQGFSSQFGLNVQIARNAPTDQQAVALFQALNPAIASYDPLAQQAAASTRQTAGLATMVGEMFFGSPVGLAAGGTALLLNLRAIAFPNSEFRSSFSQAMPEDSLGLCGKTGATAAHTRIAYLWATRVPNVGPPAVTISKENSLPTGIKSPLPVAAPDTAWKYIDRTRDWTLQPANGKPVSVKVQKLGDAQKLELDLKGVAPGHYALQGSWDWDHFLATGSIDVRALDDFKSARLAPSSQDRLVANSGKVPVTLDAGSGNGDFEFVSKVEIEKLHDQFASPSPVPFVLPQGLRRGPQKEVSLQIDTSGLDPGDYKLIVSQIDGKTHDVPLEIMPPPPTLENLPIVVNQGVSRVNFTLKGQRLDLLKGLEIPNGAAELERPAPGQKERKILLQLPANLSIGATLTVRALEEGRSEPLTFSDAIRIAGPKPSIVGLTVASPPEQRVQLNEHELPGGMFLSAMLKVEHLQPNGIVRLGCGSGDELALHLGDRSGSSRAEQLTPNQVFLSFDTGQWPNGCELQVSIANGNEGESAPSTLGRIVLLPRIEELDLTTDDDANDSFQASLTGEDLETIEKIGWAADQSHPVDGLPVPTSDGQKEKLLSPIPPPPDSDPQLWIWLRNESTPRVTTIRPNSGQSVARSAAQ